MKTQIELSKGCGKDLGWCSDKLLRNACCGEETELGIEYCEICQVLLQQSKEFIEKIDKFNINKFIELHKVQQLLSIDYSDEELLELFKQQLKSSIIGSEEKK